MKIEIKYQVDGIDKIGKISNGDWIDLRSAETVIMKRGDFKLISLGVSMRLPDGYEANVVPRSSTFKNYGIIQTNSFGVIDNSYCGENDIWKFPAYATRDCKINKNDRICQFRINKTMSEENPLLSILEVKELGNASRDGFGSTGIK